MTAMIKLISIILGEWAVIHLAFEAGAPMWVPFAVLLYIVPSLFAILINHPHTAAIMGLNLLLGWTFLCWIAALIWRLTEPSLASAQAVSTASRWKRIGGKARWQ
jgi:hypothetical protein